MLPSRFLPILVFLLFHSTANVCSARWATIEDSGAISLFDNTEIRVAENGTWILDRKSEMEIRNEEGRNAFGTLTIRYNSRAARITELHAEIRNKDGNHVVPAELIEDKPVASTSDGFDETHQIAIAYPAVEIGSRLYLQYRKETAEVPIPDFYADEFEYGTDVLEKKSETTIRSARPLFVQTNDPRQHLEVKKSREKQDHVVTISLKDDVFEKVVDEEEPALHRSDRTWVVVATSEKYEDLARAVADQYEEVINSKLPPVLEKILAAAKTKKSTVEQANTITSLLADEVRYLGDWRPTRGGHIPRALEKIVSTKFGDCKDLSVITTAILRRLGYHAQVAWVERGIQSTPLPNLPNDSVFNHAIVWFRTKERTFWIDPTNLASFGQGIFDDIIDRKALIIDGGNPRLETIEAPRPADSELSRDVTFRFGTNGDAHIAANIKYAGRSATLLTGMAREMSKESINHFVAKAIAEENYVKWSKIEPYDLTSRITRDLEFRTKVGVKNFAMRTTAGSAYQLNRNELGTLIDLETEGRVSDLFLGYPQRERATYRMDQIQLVGNLPHDCRIDSPWIKAERTFRREKDQVIVRDLREIKRSSVRNGELRSAAFERFQNQLQDCFHQIAVVFRTLKELPADE